MSQIIFQGKRDGSKFEVIAGWDSPTREYFLTVLDAEDEPIWSSVYEPSERDADSTDRLRSKLDELGICPPIGFWDLVAQKAGNEVWQGIYTPGGGHYWQHVSRPFD